jgi:hypothetical protein
MPSRLFSQVLNARYEAPTKAVIVAKQTSLNQAVEEMCSASAVQCPSPGTFELHCN